MFPFAKPKNVNDVVTLRASAALSTVGATNEAAVKLSRPANAIVFELDLTAAATDVGDTLDVKIQTKLDGTNWVDVVAFTQCLGNGGAKRHVAKIMCSTAQAMFETGTALTAGNVRHLIGDEWRVVSTIVDANANASFTFGVYALVC